MSSKHVFWGMVGFLVILAGLTIGGTYLATMMLRGQASKLSDLKLSSAVLTKQQQQLTQAKKDLVKYQSLLTIAKSVVPQDKDQAEGVREIVNIASQNGVALGSITFSASTLGTAAAGSSATGTTSTGTTSTPAATTPSATSALTQVKPVQGIPGVYDLAITVQSDAGKPCTYAQFINFLSDLEHNRRTAQVSTISIQPLQSNRNQLTFNLTIDEFIKP